MHLARSSLFWHLIKKIEKEDCEVLMCCNASAGVWKLVGSFVLNNFENVLSKEKSGWYFDNNFGIFQKLPKQKLSKLQM